MNENRRLQYLEAIGIDNYVPRWLLPNVPEPRNCEFQVGADDGTERSSGGHLSKFSAAAENTDEARRVAEPASSSAKGGDQISAEAIASVNKNLASVLEDLSGAPEKRAAASKGLANGSTNDVVEAQDQLKSAKASTQDDVAAEKAAFNLGLWFTDTGIQVVDSREAGDALPTAALLSNVLVASGLIQTNLPVMETQVWPFPGMPEKEQGWDAAFAMMSDFFQFRFETKAAKAMILCGEDAAKSVLGPDTDCGSLLFKCVPVKQFDVQALVLPSLRDFLYRPELKSSLWQALSPLRDRQD